MGCENLKNTGNNNPRCYKGAIVGAFVSEKKFSLSKTNILLQAQWNTLLLAEKPDRVYMIYDKDDPAVVAQREPRTITSASGKNHYAGVTPLALSFDVNKPVYEEIRNKLLSPLADADVFVMYITSEGYIIGKENSETAVIEAMKATVIKNVLAAEGYGSLEKIRYVISETESKNDLALRYDVKPTDFNVFDLEQIINVDLEQISASATSLVIKATEAGSDGTIPVTTLTVTAGASWTATGAGTISGATYSSATGYYTIAGTGFTDDTVITLKNPATSLVFYEESAPLSIDVT